MIKFFKYLGESLKQSKIKVSFWQSVKELQNSYLKEIAEKLWVKSEKISENFAEILKQF